MNYEKLPQTIFSQFQFFIFIQFQQIWTGLNFDFHQIDQCIYSILSN